MAASPSPSDTSLPLQPAEVQFSDDAPPFSPRYGDGYHPPGGAFAQAQHVFLSGNGLPGRWQGRPRFIVLETGFGLGSNFLATWDAWRRDPQRSRQLVFISVERHPVRRDDLARAHAGSPLAELADALVRAWPPLTPNLHRLEFDEGQVQLMLLLGDAAESLADLVARVDAFFLDGFAPAKNAEMWSERVFKAIGRLAAPGATAATWSAARPVRDGLAGAGFEVQRVPGIGGKFDVTWARHAPVFTPPQPPGRPQMRQSRDHHALIVGGGLAGCAAAWALAQQGWRSTVLERLPGPAQATSGNAAGLFHGIVNGQDGPHARFNRAAALEAARAVRHAVERHGVPGDVRGLLRLETSGAPLPELRRLLARLGLPADYVELCDAASASAVAGLALSHPAWHYPGGGWVQPGGLARSFLGRAGTLTRFVGDTQVERLARHASQDWQLLDADGRVLAQADTVVLASAADTARLWPGLQGPQAVRGQLSMLPLAAPEAQGLALPRLPIAGGGYLLPAIDGLAMFGATSQSGDTDPAVRETDHRHNLRQLARLSGWTRDPDAPLPETLQGRTGWRWVAEDRLPMIGAVADVARHPDARHTPERPRFVHREPGLFVFTALGSRGITWSALGAQVLASWVTGSPAPVEAHLLDAIDPARFMCRAARHADKTRNKKAP